MSDRFEGFLTMHEGVRCPQCLGYVETANGCDYCLRGHIDDALIAAQLDPIHAAEFLAGCEAVLIARRAMAELRAAEAV